MRGSKPHKTGLARHLRHSATPHEQSIWKHLRARNLDGHKFVRQEPIGPYVVDFVCREKRLVIEIDGGQHATDERDEIRGQWLTDHKYRVLRFWNNDVDNNLEGVLETILTELQAEGPPHPALADGEDRPLPARGER